MADEDVVVDEIQAEPIQTNSQAIADFLKAVEDQNFTQAERQFNDMIGDRLQDTLDQAKMKIASGFYDEEEPTEEEELELDDSEIEAELDDEEEPEEDTAEEEGKNIYAGGEV